MSTFSLRWRQRYAVWSQKLNVDIYVAYAEANGHATEALSNVRTVKAMSTELQGDERPLVVEHLRGAMHRRVAAVFYTRFSVLLVRCFFQ